MITTAKEFRDYLNGPEWAQFLKQMDDVQRQAAWEGGLIPPENPLDPEVLELFEGPDGVWRLPDPEPKWDDRFDAMRYAYYGNVSNFSIKMPPLWGWGI